MDETRRLAKLFRESTGQTLPVSAELAKYDITQILPVTEPDEPIRGVDFMGRDDYSGMQIQLKSRVIFDANKSHYRLGKLNTEDGWDAVALLLYNDAYEPTEALLGAVDN